VARHGRTSPAGLPNGPSALLNGAAGLATDPPRHREPAASLPGPGRGHRRLAPAAGPLVPGLAGAAR